MTDAIRDLAHISHAELLTPVLEETVRFFVDLAGMEIEAREGTSVYLRGWGDYERYGLQLTESSLPGLGHLGIRTWSREALLRRVAVIESTEYASGWVDPEYSHGPTYRFVDPDGHELELYYETERFVAPEHLRPALKNVPQRYTGRGAAAKRLDHVNLLARDVAANRRFAQDVLGYRLYEQVIDNDGVEMGAWMSLTIAAHELVYVADDAADGGRLHHLAFFVDTRDDLLRAADLFLDADVPIEAAPSKHAVAQGMFLYVYEPGGNRIELTTNSHFIYAPDHEPVVWTESERSRGQAWGVKTIESFHSYGTPDVSGRAPGPPIRPTSWIPDT